MCYDTIMAKKKKANPYPPKAIAKAVIKRRVKTTYRPGPLAVSAYYDESKSLQEVCGGKCLLPETVFDKLKDEPSELALAVNRGSVTLARNAPAPRDLPDDWKGEIDTNRLGVRI